jgi:cathepsin B
MRLSLLALVLSAAAAMPRTPPKIDFDFVTTINQTTGRINSTIPTPPTPPVLKTIAVSEAKSVVGIIQPAAPPFNKRVENLFCNDPTMAGGVNQMELEPFFNETVCYNLPLGGAPPGSTQTDCLIHTLGELMPADGFAGYPRTGVYSNSTYVGTKTTPEGETITQWRSYHAGDGSIARVEGYTYNITLYTTWLYEVDDANHFHSINVTSLQVTTCLSGTIHPCPGPSTGNETHFTHTHFTGTVSPAPASDISVPTGVECVRLDAPPPGARTWAGPPPSKARDSTTHVNDARLIAAINSEPGLTWLAGETPYYAGERLSALPLMDTHYLGQLLALPPSPHHATLSASTASIPLAFDARTAWPACTSIGTIRNQGHCGSCWAFAAIEALADRTCIASNGTARPTLSAESLIDCDATDNGCKGGFLDNAWWALQKVGAMEDACDPYLHCDYPPLPNCSKPGGGDFFRARPPPAPPAVCPTTCTDGSVPKKHFADSAYAVAPPGDVAGIQREIMAHGPVEVGFFVYSDFQQYKKGVYKKSAAAKGPEGGHAVKVLGWGTDGGTDYWLVANSWSPAWGENGFFRIARGVNECGIETTPAAGLPKL